MEEKIKEIVSSKIQEVIDAAVKATTEAILKELNNGKNIEDIAISSNSINSSSMEPQETQKNILSPDDREYLRALTEAIEKAKRNIKYYNVTTRRQIGYTDANSKNNDLIWYHNYRIVGKKHDRENLPRAVRVLTGIKSKNTISSTSVKEKGKTASNEAASSRETVGGKTKLRMVRLKDRDDTFFLSCTLRNTAYILQKINDSQTGRAEYIIYAKFDGELKEVIPLEEENISELKRHNLTYRTDLGLPIYEKEGSDDEDVVSNIEKLSENADGEVEVEVDDDNNSENDGNESEDSGGEKDEIEEKNEEDIIGKTSAAIKKMMPYKG